MGPDELLYVDVPRLDSYVEQISSPAYDKVPLWTFGLGLLGPKVEAVQTRPPRPPMREADKIKCLDEYLRKQGLLAEGRISTGLGAAETVFRFETCKAVKLFVPAATPESLAPDDSGLLEELMGPILMQGERDLQRERQVRNVVARQRDQALHAARRRLEGFEGLTIWFSSRSNVELEHQASHNSLFLIPDLRKADEPVALGSAYSALVALYDVAGGELQKTVFHSLPDNAIRNPESTFQKAFKSDSLQALRSLGAIVTGERIITSLYRLRSVLPDKDGCFITIGYPIWIIAAETASSHLHI